MFKMALKLKLIAAGIFSVLLPLIVVSFFATYTTSKSMEETSRAQTANQAKTLADNINLLLLGEVKLAVELAAGNTPIDVGTKVARDGIQSSSEEIEKLDRKIINAMKMIGNDYEVIFVTDSNGIIYSDSSDGSYKEMSVADSDYFLSAKSGKSSVGNVIRTKKTNNIVIPVCAPIISKSGKFVGAITALVKIGFIADRAANTKIGQTGYAFIVDPEGLILAHPKKEYVLDLDINKIQGMEEITKRMLAHQRGSELYTFQGVRKLAGFAPIEVTGWSVGVTQPRDEFMTSVYAVRNGIILIATIFFVLMLIGVVLFSRSIIKPIVNVSDGLKNGADQVAAAASEVSSASQSLAEAASQQAASIEETSSALEEMASMTKQNAHNANQANGLMVDTSRTVTEANSTMQDLTVSMEGISKASEDTQRIIKTIDEIAFQTNLLALNAAVEAARAGEAGAGFAVVADEVRNLALRAAEAAKNTAELIEGTVRKIGIGKDLVVRTGTAFSQIVDSTSKVGELVGEIAAASSEQAQGIDQINKALAEMDTMIQQNAATSEQSASASEELHAQAGQMRAFVGGLIRIVKGNRSTTEEDGDRTPDRAAQPASAIRGKEVSRVSVKRVENSRSKLISDKKRGEEMSERRLVAPDDTDMSEF